MIFLEKELGAEALSDYRGISLLAIMLKWYVGALLYLADEYALPASHKVALTLGFEEGMACSSITAPLQILLAKSYEWDHAPAREQQFPMTVFVGDVYQAFDHLHPREAAQSLLHEGKPARLVAALSGENAGSRMEAVFNHCLTEVKVHYSRSERTGSRDAPRLWDSLL